ncbi:MAG: type II toxin-antitoxin system Phd/YefM family antitoxin, partial [Deltaproteobacteria bacterium]|nr:type II toxin-antitoxin system Phd/YefM family antitoxin [Deltaproteobacteria bacterium]
RQPEAVITVRGKDRFVVMDIAHYQYLRTCELEAALAETRSDMAAGRTVRESAEAHVARLDEAP